MPRLASRPGLDYPSKAQLTCTIRALQVVGIYGLVENKFAKAVSKKEGPKKFPGAPFSVSFSQLPAVKKTPKTVHLDFFCLFLFCDGFMYYCLN